MPCATGRSDVAEIQGLYGAFSFSEKLLQKVWLQGEFDRAGAVTTDGRRVDIVHPGKWNRLGGPDFKGARLRLAGQPEQEGDVELHLHAEDWDAHGHAADPAYRQVLLHVVLFWPPTGCVTRGAAGDPIPILPLLPILHHDLEEYAADEAVETLSGRSGTTLLADLAQQEPQRLRRLMREHAASRWAQKVHFASVRIERLGWEQACHQTALDVLGYRFNRGPMVRLASRWPLAAWTDGEVMAEAAYQAELRSWSVQGVRPANQPRARLQQYVAWCRARPTWPATLVHWAERRLTQGETTSEIRRHGAFTQAREEFAVDVMGGAVGGSRLDTLICDGFLPLAGARAGATNLPTATLYTVWFHWFCGDLPPMVVAGMRQLELADGRVQPACHGLGQGLLGWLIDRDAQR